MSRAFTRDIAPTGGWQRRPGERVAWTDGRVAIAARSGARAEVIDIHIAPASTKDATLSPRMRRGIARLQRDAAGPINPPAWGGDPGKDREVAGTREVKGTGAGPTAGGGAGPGLHTELLGQYELAGARFVYDVKTGPAGSTMVYRRDLSSSTPPEQVASFPARMGSYIHTSLDTQFLNVWRSDAQVIDQNAPGPAAAKATEDHHNRQIALRRVSATVDTAGKVAGRRAQAAVAKWAQAITKINAGNAAFWSRR
jgi:hypothetical protein